MKSCISYLLLLTLTVMLVGCGVSKTVSPTYTPVLTKVVISLQTSNAAQATPVGKLTLQQYGTPVDFELEAFDQNNAVESWCGDTAGVQFTVTSTLNPLVPLNNPPVEVEHFYSYSPTVSGNDTVSVQAFCVSNSPGVPPPATTVSATADITVTSNAVTTIALAQQSNNTVTATVTTADGFATEGNAIQLNWLTTPPPNGGLAPIPCQGSGSGTVFTLPAFQPPYFEICSLTATFTSGGTTVVSNTVSYDSPVPE